MKSSPLPLGASSLAWHVHVQTTTKSEVLGKPLEKDVSEEANEQLNVMEEELCHLERSRFNLLVHFISD